VIPQQIAVVDTTPEKIIPEVINKPEPITVKALDTLKKSKGLDVIEGKSFILKGVEYATDSFNLTEKGKAAIDSLLIPLLLERPDDVLIFGSHTDDHGSHPYNVKLSNKRAAQVIKYLIEKGIAKTRISGKGYGETQPMAPNHLADGTDNPEGRRQNRRTEFMLLKQ
jgi:outer membrane protein OmpA-like peptidoglycan-associated protein